MIVDLKGLPESGEEYSFNRESEEFRGVLDDLVGQNDFSVEVRIEPLGNSYQLIGKFQSKYVDNCSRCGVPIDVPIKNKIHEILMIEDVRPRTTQSTHGQQSVDFSEKGPSVTYIHSSQFDLAEFIHEMFAISMEPYPKCDDDKDCNPTLTYEEGSVGDKGHPAFSVLKNLKTKH